MSKHNLIETVMGAVVLAVAGGFLVFAYQGSNVKAVNGYHIQAKFNNVSGLARGADVRIGGIKVGVVSALDLDPKSYQAIATFEVRPDAAIPTDSNAAVVSDGLLGSKYVSISPGGDEAMLKEGDSIGFTQDSVNLEELIGKMVFSGGGVEKEDSHEAPEAPKPASGGLLD